MYFNISYVSYVPVHCATFQAHSICLYMCDYVLCTVCVHVFEHSHD